MSQQTHKITSMPMKL